MNFSGNDIRAVRKKHRLSRKELADFLEVSPVTIEKWEQHGNQMVRPKYHTKLAQLSGIGAAGIVTGLLAAPVLLAPALIAGVGLGLGTLISDEGIDKASKLLEGLKRLSPEERRAFIALTKKMSAEMVT